MRWCSSARRIRSGRCGRSRGRWASCTSRIRREEDESGIVKGRTDPFPTRRYRGGRWNKKEGSTMEGILFDIEMFASPVTVLLGLVLLAIGVCGILLGYMADKEAS